MSRVHQFSKYPELFGMSEAAEKSQKAMKARREARDRRQEYKEEYAAGREALGSKVKKAALEQHTVKGTTTGAAIGGTAGAATAAGIAAAAGAAAGASASGPFAPIGAAIGALIGAAAGAIGGAVAGEVEGGEAASQLAEAEVLGAHEGARAAKGDLARAEAAQRLASRAASLRDTPAQSFKRVESPGRSERSAPSSPRGHRPGRLLS